MIVCAGATKQSLDVLLVDDSGLPLTGLVAATFPAVKWSLAGAYADQTVTLSDLAALTASWAEGGVKERGGGRYRLDLPDAVFEAQGEVSVRGEASGKHLVAPLIDVRGAGSCGASSSPDCGSAAASSGTAADTDLAAQIAAVAAGPASAEADGQKLTAQRLPDLIAADRHLAQAQGARGPARGLRFTRLNPPGAV
jgi:hypothetical protein